MFCRCREGCLLQRYSCGFLPAVLLSSKFSCLSCSALAAAFCLQFCSVANFHASPAVLFRCGFLPAVLLSSKFFMPLLQCFRCGFLPAVLLSSKFSCLSCSAFQLRLFGCSSAQWQIFMPLQILHLLSASSYPRKATSVSGISLFRSFRTCSRCPSAGVVHFSGAITPSLSR